MSEGHAVVLTGASGGLGQAFARELAPRCRSMVLCGRDEPRLLALQRQLTERHPGVELRTVVGDLAEPSTLKRLVDACTTLERGIDLLINAAGMNDFRSFARQDPVMVGRLLQVNLLVPVLTAQALLPLLAAQPRAQIVNIGSILGYLGYPGFALYCATKFGLRGFTQALRRELADTSVKVRYFAPRAVRTGLNSAAVAGMNAELGTAEDTPQSVALALSRFLDRAGAERRLGFPERLYVWLNRIAPVINDKAIRGQLPVIRKHLEAGETPAEHPQRRPT